MNAFNFLTLNRERTPGTGLTMMLDKGIGIMSLKDLLQISGEYIDLAKLGWCTSAIHDRDLVKKKTEIYSSYDVIPYPGGTLFEIAYLQNKIPQFLDEAQELGFGAIEISDGSVNISLENRENLINQVKERDFMVLTEVGKKDPQKDSKLKAQDRVKLVNFDLQTGADKVLIEAREGGKGIGIYDGEGKIKKDDVETIIENTDVSKIIWEAPLKDQQTYLILKFGSNVNLGNISPEEITALETMRRGLRADTLGKMNFNVLK